MIFVDALRVALEQIIMIYYCTARPTKKTSYDMN